VIDIRPKPTGHGSIYEPTQMGRGLWEVLMAMQTWTLKWMDVAPEHSEPDVVLWSWCHGFMRQDRLPEGRVLVRFEFPGQPIYLRRLWLLLEQKEGEVCTKFPGFEEAVIVVVEDLQTFARWHLGLSRGAPRCAPGISASPANGS